MLYQIKSYLKFLSKSTNQHGVHSPFVYDFVTKCIYLKKQTSEYKVLKSIRKNVLSNKSVISVTDFGRGSRVFTSNQRQVAAIAKNAGISLKRQKLLFRIVSYFKPKRILELGTSVGLGTASLSLGNPSATITTIEGCPNTSNIATQLFQEFQLKNIHLKNETFENFFKEATNNSYDLVYIDGNHSKENTLQYFNFLLKKTHNDALFIFDDIYWSPSMTAAWQEIIQHPKVTVSMDIFHWGLVFFRKEQEKQHFTIRL
ncbi:MAG: class I SAM-dependent methyltransferase [Flavobacteriaceae bacterium]